MSELVLLLLTLLLSGCSYFRGGNGEDELEAEPQTGIRYGVEIDGEGVDDEIRSTLPERLGRQPDDLPAACQRVRAAPSCGSRPPQHRERAQEPRVLRGYRQI